MIDPTRLRAIIKERGHEWLEKAQGFRDSKRNHEKPLGWCWHDRIDGFEAALRLVDDALTTLENDRTVEKYHEDAAKMRDRVLQRIKEQT